MNPWTLEGYMKTRTSSLGGSLAIFCALVPVLQVGSEAATTARDLFTALDTVGSGEELIHDRLSETPGEFAWGESYLLLSYVTMYEATGEKRHLDKLVSRFRALLSLRDDKKGKRDELRNAVLPAWGSIGYSGGKRTCWTVHAGMLTFPAARFCRLVKARPSLWKTYGRTATEFKAALQETVAAFDPYWREGPEADEGHYVEPALGGKHLPLNQQNALGRTMLDLSVVTKQRSYRDKTTKLARFLKRRLTLRKEGAFEWCYWPNLQPPYVQGSEDISHAAINVDFAVRCYENGIVFSKEDVQAFVTTFLKLIYKGPGRFADTVAGSGEGTYAPQIGRWCNLAVVEPEVAKILADYFLNHQPPLQGTTTMLALSYLTKYGY